MNQKDYELLLELYETKNITRVAQKLFVSQPALTKRLKNLEEELGCELLVRSKKGVIFTPLGESIMPYIRHLAATARQMTDYISANQGFIGGTLNLGTSLNFSQYRLPAALKDYTERYPLVDIRITTGQSRNLYRMLKRDEISIAIIRGDFKWDEGRFLLASEPMCLVCSKEHRGRPLQTYPQIGRHTDAGLTAQMQTWLGEQDLSHYPVKLWIDDIDSCKEMARYGLGWCILPRICLDDFDGHIEPLFFYDGTPFCRQTHVLYKNSYYELPQVRLFFECLTENEKRYQT